MSITPEMIDRAARNLRETTQGGKTNGAQLKEWSLLPKSAKKKWVELAAGALEAAISEERT